MQGETIAEILFYADKWNIGFVEQSAADFIGSKGLKQIHWLPEDHADYSADPFVFTFNHTVYTYYEFLNFRDGRGKICRIEGFDFSTRRQVSGFQPPGIHLSYPYIFTAGGVWYCMPETAEANEVALYEISVSGSASVTRCRTLLHGAPYLDSSIILYKGRYWIFTSKKQRPCEILIYHAATLNDTFEPHAMNPIACDRRSFRSAGHLFIVNGTLYRPTQNLQGQYGGSLLINKINVLTPHEFDSERLFEVLPEAPYPAGLHNISFTNGIIVIDGKRKVRSPVMIVKKMSMRLKYLLRKMRLALHHHPGRKAPAQTHDA